MDKKRPGPKIKSFEERVHQIGFNTTGYIINKFGSKDRLRKEVKKFVDNWQDNAT